MRLFLLFSIQATANNQFINFLLAHVISIVLPGNGPDIACFSIHSCDKSFDIHGYSEVPFMPEVWKYSPGPVKFKWL